MAAPLDQTQQEQEWIARAQGGDKAAYGRLVERYHRLVVSVAYHHGLDLTAAQDAAQETFIKAWLALPRFEGDLKAWLCRIAINAAADIRRRERPAGQLEEDAVAAESPDEQVEASARRRAVRQALAQLPEASRAALILREYEGLTYAEIAQALDIPVGTVMSRLNYARTRLRELLTEMGAHT